MRKACSGAGASRTPAARRFFSTAAENELLLRPIGGTVYLMPPYVLDEEEVAGLAARTIKTFESVIAG